MEAVQITAYQVTREIQALGSSTPSKHNGVVSHSGRLGVSGLEAK